MPTDLTVLDERCPFPEGMAAAPADLLSLQTNIDNAFGRLLVGLLGGPNGLPAPGFYAPLSITPTGGLNISIGGAGTLAFVQGRFADSPPTDAITLNPAPTTGPRTDLIAVKFNRAAGSATINRRVRPDNAPVGYFESQFTLVGGTATVTFPSQAYSVPPGVFPVEVAPDSANPGAQLTLTTTDTQCVITSSDSTDTRTFNIFVIGSSSTANGTPTSIGMTEAQLTYQYVAGTVGGGIPATPAGYEAFATIVVHKNETAISNADITYLFPTFASPLQNFVCETIVANQGITSTGPIDTVGNFAINSGGGITAQNAGIFGIGQGGVQVGGTSNRPLITSFATDNLTYANWEGPTNLGLTSPPPFNFSIGANTPSCAVVSFGYQGAGGYVGPAGYTTNGATPSVYGLSAAIASTLSTQGAATLASIVVPTSGSTFLGGALGVVGPTTLNSKLQVNAALGVTGAATLGSALVTNNLTVDGQIFGDISPNLESGDGYLVFSKDGSKSVIDFTVRTIAMSELTVVDGHGSYAVFQTDDVIVSATANVQVSVGGNATPTPAVACLSSESNFAQGRAIFRVYKLDGTSIGPNTGVFATVITNNVPHS